MKLVYIHGAGASGGSFNYLREHLSQYDDYVLEYNANLGFEHNLELMINVISGFSRVFFIGHSMGGLYALHLAKHYKKRTMGAVTMGTPYGGVVVADWLRYIMPFSRVLRDISPSSQVIRDTEKIPLIHPWTNIVTTSGESAWLVEPNDGVVTVSSQRKRSDIELIELALNHYEVVISPKTVEIINQKIGKYTETYDNTHGKGGSQGKTADSQER